MHVGSLTPSALAPGGPCKGRRQGSVRSRTVTRPRIEEEENGKSDIPEANGPRRMSSLPMVKSPMACPCPSSIAWTRDMEALAR